MSVDRRRVKLLANGLPRLIGFAGKIGSGKSEAAKFFQQTHRKISFADLVYGAVSGATLFSTTFIKDNKKRQVPGLPEGITFRKLLQTMGTEWGRQQVCDDFWVRMWKISVNNYLASLSGHHGVGTQGIIVDDIRFVNEIMAVHELGGVVIYCQLETAQDAEPQLDLHVSETSIGPSQCDSLVMNDFGSPHFADGFFHTGIMAALNEVIVQDRAGAAAL